VQRRRQIWQDYVNVYSREEIRVGRLRQGSVVGILSWRLQNYLRSLYIDTCSKWIRMSGEYGALTERDREGGGLSLKEISNGHDGFLSIVDKTVGDILFINRSTVWLQTSQTSISAYQITRCHILEYSSRLMTPPPPRTCRSHVLSTVLWSSVLPVQSKRDPCVSTDGRSVKPTPECVYISVCTYIHTQS